MSVSDDLKEAVASLQAQETLVKEFVVSTLEKLKALQTALDNANIDNPAVVQAIADINQEVADLKADIAQA